jgi:hypothetical protein
MDSVIGDEPSGSKYALICTECATHNGLVLAHEYQTARFRCFRCGVLNDKNPLRKRESEPGFDMSGRRMSDPEVTLGKELVDGGKEEVERSKRHTISEGFFEFVEIEERSRRVDEEGYVGDESNLSLEEIDEKIEKS